MAIKPSVHTESIVRSIDQTVKKIRLIFAVFCHGDEKTSNFLFKNYFYFNRTIEGSIPIVSIDTIDHALH